MPWFVTLLLLLAPAASYSQLREPQEQEEEQQQQEQQEQQQREQQQQQQQQQEKAPPRPRVETVIGGIVIIRGNRAAEPPAESSGPSSTEEKEKQESSAAAGDGAEGKQAEPSASSAPKLPRTVESERYIYDGSGRRRPAPDSVSTRNAPGSSDSTTTLRTINGRRVPYLQEKERVVAKTATGTVTERRTQRYDANGRPTQQELVRTQTRKLPDGTVETIETLYIENINGRMEPAGRSVIRSKVTGATTTTETVSEKPSIYGGFRAYAREKSVETRQGESSSRIETVRYQTDGEGRMRETAREETSLKKSGAVSTTETVVYERGVEGRMEVVRRTVGRLVERPDGSKSEKIETYGFRVGDGPRNVNTSRPQLQEVVEREVKVGPDGETRERTSVRTRGVADTSRMSGPTVSERVSRPQADGETVRTQVYEQGVNGRLVPTQVVVEKIKK